MVLLKNIILDILNIPEQEYNVKKKKARYIVYIPTTMRKKNMLSETVSFATVKYIFGKTNKSRIGVDAR